MDRKSIIDMAHGAFKERADYEMAKILENIHWFGNKIYCLNDRIGISYVAEWLDPVQE